MRKIFVIILKSNIEYFYYYFLFDGIGLKFWVNKMYMLYVLLVYMNLYCYV